jgi:WD40 repeat protein
LVSLSFDAWKPGAAEPATVTVPVRVIEAVESPQLKATLKGSEEFVRKVAWSPDGKTLASLSGAGTEVKLWDLDSKKERAVLRSDLGNSFSLEFSPDGKTIYVSHFKNDPKSGPAGGISIWDVTSGQRTGLLQQNPPRGVPQIALSPDGKTLAAREVWQDGDAGKGEYKTRDTLWDVAGGKATFSLDDPNANALAFSHDGKILARSVYIIKDRRLDGVEVRRYDLSTQKELPVLSNTVSKNPISLLDFSPDGQTLAGCDYQGNIILWDTASGKMRRSIKRDERGLVSSLAFSPDGKTLVSGISNSPRDHEPGLIEVLDPATGEKRMTLTGHTNGVQSIAFSPDGKLLASGGLDRTIRVWDLTTPAAASR